MKIVEKDTSASLLAATTPVVEEETKMIGPRQESDAVAQLEEPLARPRFPLVVKVNRPGVTEPKPEREIEEKKDAELEPVVEEIKESEATTVGNIIEVIPRGSAEIDRKLAAGI